MDTLIIPLLLSLGINMMMFIPAYFLRTDKLTDISYALTFIFIAGYGLLYSSYTFLDFVLAAMIVVWAVRLGGYLLIRIFVFKKDKRFDKMRNSFTAFGRFWLLQGLTVWAVLIPSLLFFAHGNKEGSFFAFAGVVLWVVGITIESIADVQKFMFKLRGDEGGKWIEEGLWKYARHPNYFGEILLWWGVYVFTLSSVSMFGALVGLAGPLFITLLILFVSGVPLLEKYAEKKWGDDKAYQQYKKRSRLLIPLPRI